MAARENDFSLMRCTMTRIVRFVRAFSILLPVLLFAFFYFAAYNYWSKNVGSGAWPPAWPESRTRFVLLVITTPVWAVCMAAWTKLPSSRFRGYLPAPTSQADDKELKTPGKRMSWSTIQLSMYLFLSVSGICLLLAYEHPNDIRFRPLLEKAVRYPRPEGYGHGQKVFVAAMFHNNAKIMPHWTEQMTRVLYYIGTDNVFVSIIESHSSDTTPDLLLDFDKKLEGMGIARRIIVRDVSTPQPGSTRSDGTDTRIRTLAALRNRVMEPLVERGGFDIILFSNDVLVTAESVVELLRTRGGDWDMVCGLDMSFWGLYDAWVVRDRLGQLVSSLWPFLIEETGRRAIMADDPAPVFTCWNGITAFRADPFLPIELRSPGRLSTTPFRQQLPVTHPAYPRPANQTSATTPPIQFRASNSKECFSSESFNLPYDLRRQFDLTNIYINPRVIVAYDWNHYIWFKYVTRHWLVKWWMNTIEEGRDLTAARMIIGQADHVWKWDGGDCQPWY